MSAATPRRWCSSRPDGLPLATGLPAGTGRLGWPSERLVGTGTGLGAVTVAANACWRVLRRATGVSLAATAAVIRLVPVWVAGSWWLAARLAELTHVLSRW